MMTLLPNTPRYDPTERHVISEILNHSNFINATAESKKTILLEMARTQYLDDQIKPFDLFFRDHSLRRIFSGATVLDLGCFCGGSTVSYAERWNVKNMYGLDSKEHFIEAALLFSSSRDNKNVNYHFDLGFGESLPYETESFDGIVSMDTFEHVQSLKDVLFECKRVLRLGGRLFSVFPSYYQPFGGAHLDTVTKMPFIQWVFDSRILNRAYDDILESRGSEAHWYKSTIRQENDWRKLRGGIGVNGTTFRYFRSIVSEVGFSNVIFLPTPLLYPSDLSVAHPEIKYFCQLLKPFLRFDVIQDYLSQRIVSIVTK
jgi:SAM-dependent methyltransferase